MQGNAPGAPDLQGSQAVCYNSRGPKIGP